uniref:Secreted protein n=1 Tax=Brugia timori TaxID=42155 RepID=A0A0R3Q924_9BILA
LVNSCFEIASQPYIRIIVPSPRPIRSRPWLLIYLVAVTSQPSSLSYMDGGEFFKLFHWHFMFVSSFGCSNTTLCSDCSGKTSLNSHTAILLSISARHIR